MTSIKRTIQNFYLFQTFFSLLIWFPVFYEIQKKTGLNDSEIFRIQSIYYLAFCFLEIPTGWFADRWGRKRSMIWGAFFSAIANALPVFSANYFGFLWHFLLIAFSRSLVSGASSAYLFDYLKQHNAVGEYAKAEGRARAYSLIAKVGVWVFVGFMMHWHLMLPYVFSAFAAVLAWWMVLSLPKEELLQPHASPSVNRVSLLEIFQLLFQYPLLPLLMFQGISIFVLPRICQVNLYQPLMESREFSSDWYGPVMSILTLFEAFGAAYPHWPIEGILDIFKKRHSNENALTRDFLSVSVMTILLGISLVGLSIVGNWGLIFWLSFLSWVAGISYPVQRRLMNNVITLSGKNEARATLLSVESILDRGASSGVALLLGGMVAGGGMPLFLILSALLSLLVLGVVYLAVKIFVRFH